MAAEAFAQALYKSSWVNGVQDRESVPFPCPKPSTSVNQEIRCERAWSS
jgi:hypothetical protein